MVFERGLGLIPSPQFYASLPEYGNRVSRSDWKNFSLRHFCPAVYDQGQQGSCAGHAAVAALAVCRARDGRGTERLSPCFVYGMVNGGQDRGATIQSVAETIARDGACLETTVPAGQIWKNRFPQQAFVEAKRFRAEITNACRTFDDVVSAVLLGDPVIIGVMIGSAFDNMGPRDGIIAPARGNEQGGHAMLACGVKQINGRWYLEILNSWGERFAVGGYCWMEESYWRQWSENYAVRLTTDDPQGDNPPNVQ